MQLSATLFEQIAQSLSGQLAPGAAPAPAEPAPAAPAPAEPAGPDGSQRRREPRLGVRAQVTLIPLTDRQACGSIDVPIRDLSAGGIGFLHTGPITLDDQFVVLLPAGRESAAVLCEVAYYQPLADRVQTVGARFVRVLRQPVDDPGTSLPLPAQRPAPVRRAAS